MFKRKTKKNISQDLYALSPADSSSYSAITTSDSSTGSLSSKDLYNYYQQYAGARTTGPTPVYPEVNTGSWDNTSWTKEEKKAFANVGFVFNKKSKQWEIEIGTKIAIPRDAGILKWVGKDGTPTEKMIRAIKEAKAEIVEKLTAKVILAELIKPRDIK